MWGGGGSDIGSLWPDHSSVDSNRSGYVYVKVKCSIFKTGIGMQVTVTAATPESSQLSETQVSSPKQRSICLVFSAIYCYCLLCFLFLFFKNRKYGPYNCPSCDIRFFIILYVMLVVS